MRTAPCAMPGNTSINELIWVPPNSVTVHSGYCRGILVAATYRKGGHHVKKPDCQAKLQVWQAGFHSKSGSKEDRTIPTLQRIPGPQRVLYPAAVVPRGGCQ